MESSDDESVDDLASMPEYWFSRIARGKSATTDRGDRSSISWSTTKEMFLHPTLPRPPLFWDNMFSISCSFAILLDPLFLYLPILDENMKCLAFDKNLKKIALVLRTVTDIPYILNIIFEIPDILERARRWAHFHLSFGFAKELAMEIWKSHIPNDTLAALPIPQIVILIFFSTMRGSRSLTRMRILNSLIVLQYLPRVYPIYRFCKKLNKRNLDKSIPNKEVAIWVPGLINFILYILASHVLGAFWYFFSLQREIDCWGYSCRSENGCEISTFNCDDNTFRNITVLNNFCPINPPNATIFDFGIFLDALQSGILRSTNFPQKFLQCFSWGLRNLSSFASNLKTSTYAWETLFVVCISISGLILFIYLLGHLQATDRSFRVWRKMDIIRGNIKFISSEYGLPNMAMPVEIMIYKWLQNDENLDTENIFSLLSMKLQRYIKRHLFFATLHKIPVLETMDKQVLKAICDHLEQVTHDKGSYIIREGEPLDLMIFITLGTALTYTTNDGGTSTATSSSIDHLGKGDCYGEQLLNWAAQPTSSFSGLPISKRTVKCHKKVEVFAIMAKDLQRILLSRSTESTDHIQVADGNV